MPPQALKDDVKAIADGYGAGGFVDVDINPQGTPNGPGVVDLTYNISEGDRAHLSSGSTLLATPGPKTKFCAVKFLILPGDIFNTVRVDTSKSRLENLGYFEKVDTYPEDTGIPGRKDLLVQVAGKTNRSTQLRRRFQHASKACSALSS